MILIGLGANLPSASAGPPRATLEAAIEAMAAGGICIRARSRWYKSPPVPPSDQPWYVNGAVRVDTGHDPVALLDMLMAIERRFGRRRQAANAARTLDLDLLAYGDQVTGPGARPELPHPRLSRRAFVLRPLADIAPRWVNPATGASISALIAALPADAVAEPLEDG